MLNLMLYNVDGLKLMYQSLVLPYLDYCSFVWANCNQTLKNEVQRLQNRAARLITGDSYDIRPKDIKYKQIGMEKSLGTWNFTNRGICY